MGEAKEHEGGDRRACVPIIPIRPPGRSAKVTNIAGIYLHRSQIIAIITQSTSGRGECYHDKGKQKGIDNVGGDINARVYGRERLKAKPKNNNPLHGAASLTASKVEVFAEMQRVSILVQEPTVDGLEEAACVIVRDIEFRSNDGKPTSQDCSAHGRRTSACE